MKELEDKVLKCEGCPYNRGDCSWPGTQLPCGQFNCWHEVHLRLWEEEDDEGR